MINDNERIKLLYRFGLANFHKERLIAYGCEHIIALRQDDFLEALKAARNEENSISLGSYVGFKNKGEAMLFKLLWG